MQRNADAAWRAADLQHDDRWIFTVPAAHAQALGNTLREAYRPDKPLFDYRPEEIDLGNTWPLIADAIAMAHHGTGIALLRGLPREGLEQAHIELLNWAIGLHAGVARPQGRASQYIAAVRDAGTDYRAATGRGYSSSAELDFHVDGADLTTLICYNPAREGGQSLITSAVSAHRVMGAERADLVDLMHADFYFSRQAEQAPDEPEYYAQPVFEQHQERLFTKWNRNRIQSAQRFDAVPRLTPGQREAMDLLDAIVRRPELMYTMYLRPGDLQIFNNYTVVHSRTAFVDFDEPARKRMLSRLWIAPPDSVRLPASWKHFFRSIEPGTVRGGIRGHEYGQRHREFESRQARNLGMATTAE